MWRLESGGTPEAGASSLESLRSLEYLYSVWSLESGVCSHPGVWSLESLRSLGVWSLQSLRSLESGVT